MNSQRLTLVSVIVAVLVVAAIVIVPRLTATGSSATGTIDYASQPHVGSPDAPVKIAVFFDFLCPHCASFSETITPILKRDFVDSGKAVVYFLNFPVVNAIVSRDLAMVGECIFEQSNDAFVALEPVLMRAQASLQGRDRAIDVALQNYPDLNGSDLRQCATSEAAGAAVAADIAAASSLQLTGTPSVVVNGKVVSNPTLAAVRQAVENAAD